MIRMSSFLVCINWYLNEILRSGALISIIYILASVANVIQHQLQEVNHASARMTILREMFREQSHAAKANTIRSLLSTKMAEGTPVREHCLSMITMFNTLEVLGIEIDGES
jgi:hypothetical protein